MSEYIEHAKREFLALGYDPVEKCEDGPDKWIQENVLELLKVFHDQNHSGFSSSIAIRYFQKLASFEPLCPLTGDDHEWRRVTDNIWQNTRCGHVFKDSDGNAWDTDAKVFVNSKGFAYSGRDSVVFITFPYVPKTEYIHVDD